MTIPTMTASQWWARHRQISRIREAIDMFPDMTDEDGEVLAGCLSARLRCQDLTPDQEAAERWWDAWLKASERGRFATIVEMSLAVRDLPAVVGNELVDACQRLRGGEDMTPRQASLWGNHVVRRWDA